MYNVYERAVDNKGRVMLPSKWRGLTCTAHLSRQEVLGASLELVPCDANEPFAIAMDKQGRFRLNKIQWEAIGVLTPDVVVIEIGSDRLKFHQKTRWLAISSHAS